MYGLTTLLIGVSLLSIVSGAPVDTSLASIGNEVFAQESRVCETTIGSPLIFDIAAAANIVDNRVTCCQNNGVGSLCTTLETYETAAIGLCGVYRKCVDCAQIKKMAIDVAGSCAWKDPAVNKYKAGGYYGGVDGYMKVTIFHR